MNRAFATEMIDWSLIPGLVLQEINNKRNVVYSFPAWRSAKKQNNRVEAHTVYDGLDGAMAVWL